MLTSAAEGRGAGFEILHGGGGMSRADVSSRGGGFGNTTRGRGMSLADVSSRGERGGF